MTIQIFKAVVTEKNTPYTGKIIANTKIGQYKGLTKEEFILAVHKTTCFTFEVKEI